MQVNFKIKNIIKQYFLVIYYRINILSSKIIRPCLKELILMWHSLNLVHKESKLMCIHNRRWDLNWTRPIIIAIAKRVSHINHRSLGHHWLVKSNVVVSGKCTSNVNFLRNQKEIILLAFFLLFNFLSHLNKLIRSLYNCMLY